MEMMLNGVKKLQNSQSEKMGELWFRLKPVIIYVSPDCKLSDQISLADFRMLSFLVSSRGKGGGLLQKIGVLRQFANNLLSRLDL